eukprot:TRINITY_DN5771_c0_g3_i2.p1 TRINITY_DN5771_c0_g3~~TRINITY_DN5771_c0_g3_i2.p1  ORF type:complete len:4752 (+),score=1264.50 TRINITY_DN5771_c0_g3_i2:1602-15857(+)
MSPCDDGNVLTVNDVCVAGVCRGVDPCAGVVCAASDQCHTAGVCDVVTRLCTDPAKVNGTLCDDGMADTVNDSCVAGVCVGALVCGTGTCNATNQCYTAFCDGTVCNQLAKPVGTLCNDQNSATVDDRCVLESSSGLRGAMCVGTDRCAGVVCVSAGRCRLAGTCSPATGTCTNPAAADGTLCDDRDPTTFGDKCVMGDCVGRKRCVAVVCAAPDSCHLPSSCDPTTGECRKVQRVDGSVCDDALATTSNDTCAGGLCTGVLNCTGTAAGCSSNGQCRTVSCSGSACQLVDKPDGSGCSDYNGVTVGDRCLNGLCSGTDACSGVSCPSPTQCTMQGTCVSGASISSEWPAACSTPHRPDHTVCDDGDGATVDDVCRQGTCVGVSRCGGASCAAAGQCRERGVCDNSTGLCSDPKKPDGTACTDDDSLTDVDYCLNGVCVGSLLCSSGSCAPPASARGCAYARCVASQCVSLSRADGTACNDDDASTAADRCVSGQCVGQQVCSGVTCTATGQCMAAGTCNPRTGQCTTKFKPDDTPCDDGDINTKDDVCTAGVCKGTPKCAGVVCTALTPCHVPGQCVASSGTCTNPVGPDGNSCDDNNTATWNDRCAAGLCSGSDPCTDVVCRSISQCHSVGVCQVQGACVGAGSGGCVPTCTTPPRPNGTACDDGNAATTSDVCTMGVCRGTDLCINVTCLPTDSCHSAGQCDAATGRCSDPRMPDGAVCDDGVAATEGDVCTAGVCTGFIQCGSARCSVAGPCFNVSCVQSSCVQTARTGPCNDDMTNTVNDTCSAGVCVGVDLCAAADCVPAGQCNKRGACDAFTGSCTSPLRADATPCDDLAADTSRDACTGGVCKGVRKCENLVCTASEPQCHVAGTCDAASGLCSDPPKADGTACDDGDALTAGDVCKAGFCAGVVSCGVSTCPPGDQCTRSYCEGTTCRTAPRADGTACNDGNVATVGDQCTAGTCAGRSACATVTCGKISQCYAVGVCEEHTAACTNPVLPDNTPCDDGDPTTAGDRCVQGYCYGKRKCSGVGCAASDQCHSQGVCDPMTGLCSDPVMPDGTVCDDGDASTTADQCVSGVCSGSVQCGGVPCTTSAPCSRPSCSGGLCSPIARPARTACNDGNPATVGDLCAACPGAPAGTTTCMTCNGSDPCAGVICSNYSQCHGVGSCDRTVGRCSTPLLPDNTPCDDGNALTADDRCVMGACIGTDKCAAVVCPAATVQCKAQGACEPQSGVCTTPNAADGTTCDDGNADTVQDRCTSGQCRGAVQCGPAGARVVCSVPTSVCTLSVCAAESCAEQPVQDGTSCDDGDSRTVNDRCQSGSCIGTNPCGGVVCRPVSTCHDPGTCDTVTGVCSTPFRPDGSACDDRDATTMGDKCVAGLCTGSRKCQGVVCNADQCHTAAPCVAESGLCPDVAKADGTPCNDGDPATDRDQCLAGVCTGAVACGTTLCVASSQCGTAVCASGACAEVPAAAGSLCNDNTRATLNDTCSSGRCVGVDPCANVVCPGPSGCRLGGVCEPRTGVCSTPFKPNGWLCDDGNPTTENDQCTNGYCSGTPRCAGVVCPAAAACRERGVCDTLTGVCSDPTRQDDATCTDGNAATVQDRCSGGVCLGEISCSGTTCRAVNPCKQPVCTPSGCGEANLPDGTECNDNVAATTNDVCSAGACAGRNLCDGVSCPAPNGCRQAGSCDPRTGYCAYGIVQDGTACDDGAVWTTGDQCISGMCVGTVMCSGRVCSTSRPQCSYPSCGVGGVCTEVAKADGAACDDGSGSAEFDRCTLGQCYDANPCRGIVCLPIDQCRAAGTCDTRTGTCVGALKKEGHSCDDFDASTGADACTAAGVCRGTGRCVGVLCPASDQCHQAGVCDASTGLCADPVVADGLSCTDATSNDAGTCLAGVCHAAKTCGSTVCTRLSDARCRYRTCDGTLCAEQLRPDGTACNDDDPITQGDVCTAGVCRGVRRCDTVACTPIDACHTTVCNAATGSCEAPAAADGTLCDDRVAATTGDSCVAGVCRGVDPCANGACAAEACRGKADGAPCDDGRADSVSDVCTAGICQGTYLCATVTCSQCEGACNPRTGRCGDTPPADGTTCDAATSQGGLAGATAVAACGGGKCLATVSCGAAGCAAPTSQCRFSICVATAGGPTCETRPRFDGTACDDGKPETYGDRCAAGECTAGDLCSGVACDAATSCRAASPCNAATGMCMAGQPKSDGTACLLADQSPGVCVAGSCGATVTGCGASGLTCVPSDARCRAAVCVDGQCSERLQAAGTACDDGDPRTVDDRCSSDGTCAGVNRCGVRVCAASDQCHTAGACDPRTGLCSDPAKAEGSVCDDGDPATTSDRCYAGVCLGVVLCRAQGNVTAYCFPADPRCGRVACERGVCVERARYDGAYCNDGDPSTVDDKCAAGQCAGVSKCAAGCTPTRSCQTAGWCDPATGLCTSRAATDNTTCSDGRSDTTSDRCVAGACVGSIQCGSQGQLCESQSQCVHAVCSLGACTQQPRIDGTPCDDGDPATRVDVCTAGTCAGTSLCAGVTCSASDQCHVVGACDPMTGLCTDPIAVDGTGCDDGQQTTASDRCVAGVCVGTVACVAAPACMPVDPRCRIASCTAAGDCSETVLPEGAVCNDGDPATMADACGADNVCRGTNRCNSVTCSPTGAPCRGPAGPCLPSTGACVYDVAPDGTACDDGLPETATDSCLAGGCSSVVSCNGATCIPSETQCHSAHCSAGVCVDRIKPNGTRCDDGDPFTFDDVCTLGVCVGTERCAGVTCVLTEPQCHTLGSCDPLTGTCSDPLKPTGTVCDDNDPITVSDTCGADGVCRGTLPCGNLTCTAAGGPCRTPTCTKGVCGERDKWDGVGCSDNNPATTADTCRQGGCAGVDRCASVSCTARDACHVAGVCDAASGRCSEPAAADGSACDDGDSTTVNDRCVSGACVGSLICATNVCPVLDPHCTAATCTANACGVITRSNGTTCDDLQSATNGDVCVAGVCRGTDLCAGVVCTAAGTCRAAGVCDPTTGRCSDPALPDGARCDDSLASTSNDACYAGACHGVLLCGALRCLPSAPQCQVATCVADGCGSSQSADGTPCNDGNLATVDDQCVGGVCGGSDRCSGVTCAALSQCHDVGVCDPATGICDTPPKPWGTTCDDRDPATVGDRCVSGTCSGAVQCGAVTCFPADPRCRRPTCTAAGQCSEESRVDGTACDDLDAATQTDACSAGVCRGVSRCAGVICSPAGVCKGYGTCDARTGRCSEPAQVDGSVCSDGLSRTTGDQCSSGVCVGVLTCGASACPRPSSVCREAVCGGSPLGCTERSRADGTACDDGDASTLGDACTAGVCTGTNLCSGRACPAPARCRILSACDPLTGLCAESPALDGTACDDGDSATGPDRCVGGVCVGTVGCSGTCAVPDPRCRRSLCDSAACTQELVPDGTSCVSASAGASQCSAGECAVFDRCAGVQCSAAILCHRAGVCNPATGRCEVQQQPDGTSCDDGVSTTASDRCVAGVCVGAADCGQIECVGASQCAAASCQATNVCGTTPRPERAPCFNSSVGSAGSCSAGICAVSVVTCGSAPRAFAGASAPCSVANSQALCSGGQCKAAECCASCSLRQPPSNCSCLELVDGAADRYCPADGCVAQHCCKQAYLASRLTVSVATLVQTLAGASRALAAAVGLPDSRVASVSVRSDGGASVVTAIAHRGSDGSLTQAGFTQQMADRLAADAATGGAVSGWANGSAVTATSAKDSPPPATEATVKLQLAGAAVPADALRRAAATALGFDTAAVTAPVYTNSSGGQRQATLVVTACTSPARRDASALAAELRDKLQAAGSLSSAGVAVTGAAANGEVSAGGGSEAGCTVTLLVRGTTSTVSSSEQQLRHALARALGVSPARVGDFCFGGDVQFGGATTARVEAAVQDLSGVSDQQLSDAVRQSLSADSAGAGVLQSAGFSMAHWDAAPAPQAACSRRPCGCGQSCSVSGSTYTCGCRYPLNGTAQGQAATCVQSGLVDGTGAASRVAASPAPTTQLDTEAAALRASVDGAVNDEAWASGGWAPDAAASVKALAAASSGGLSQQAETDLLAAATAALAQDTKMRERCCGNGTTGGCCGNLASPVISAQVYDDVTRAAADLAESSPTWVGVVSCDDMDCADARESNRTDREALAASGRRYLAVLHDVAESACRQRLAAGPPTADPEPYTQTFPRYALQAAGLRAGAQNTTADTATLTSADGAASVEVVMARSDATASDAMTVCRSSVVLFGRLPYDGEGYPQRTPQASVAAASIRVPVLNSTSAAPTTVPFKLTLPRDAQLPDQALVQWNDAAADWRQGTWSAAADVGTTGRQYTTSAALHATVSGRRAALLAVSSTETLAVFGNAGWEEPSGGCFPCVVLGATWAVFLLIAIPLGCMCTKGASKATPAPEPRGLAAVVKCCHLWLSLPTALPAGWAYSNHQRVCTLFAFVFMCMGVVSVFIGKNEKVANGWEVELKVPAAAVAGAIGAVVGGILAAITFHAFIPKPGPILESRGPDSPEGKSVPLLDSPQAAKAAPPPAGRSAGYAVFFLFAAGGSALTYLFTDKYNAAEQGTRWAVGFAIGVVVHILLVDPVRCAILNAMKWPVAKTVPVAREMVEQPFTPQPLQKAVDEEPTPPREQQPQPAPAGRGLADSSLHGAGRGLGDSSLRRGRMPGRYSLPGAPPASAYHWNDLQPPATEMSVRRRGVAELWSSPHGGAHPPLSSPPQDPSARVDQRLFSQYASQRQAPTHFNLGV